jgi:hypothetical protein
MHVWVQCWQLGCQALTQDSEIVDLGHVYGLALVMPQFVVSVREELILNQHQIKI